MIDPVGVMVIYVYDMYKDDGVVELGIGRYCIGWAASGSGWRQREVDDDDRR